MAQTARKTTTAKKPVAAKANGKRKHGSRHKGKRKNPAAARSASPQSRTSAAMTKTRAKANPKRARAKRGFRNPLPQLGSVSLSEWGAFALAAIATNALTSLVANPSSWMGIGIQAGLTFLAGKFAPRSVRTAATFGAGGAAVVAVVNRLSGGAIQNAITTYVAPLIPGRAAATPAQAPATGLAGYRGMRGLVNYRTRPGFGGLVNVPSDSPAFV